MNPNPDDRNRQDASDLRREDRHCNPNSSPAPQGVAGAAAPACLDQAPRFTRPASRSDALRISSNVRAGDC